MRGVVWSGSLVLVSGLVLGWSAFPPARGESTEELPFRLEQQGEPESRTLERNGVPVKVLTVRYTVQPRDKQAVQQADLYEVVIYEKVGPGEFQEVKRIPLPRKQEKTGLSTVLCLDISGSMTEQGRIQQLRTATQAFFSRLPAEADCGLILFNHQMVRIEAPTQERAKLQALIEAAEPHGGTAYLDAAREGIRLLEKVPHRKAVIVMTDGVDLNSQTTLGGVIRLARQKNTQIYTVGIGEPGRQVPMTSVLVLDHSGSMQEPADNQDQIAKIDALKEAGKLFLSFVRPGLARTTILPFSDTPELPPPFTDEHTRLQQTLAQLKPEGETALFDALYEALLALEAERPKGRAAIVALTDGIDNSSHYRAEEVIALAKQMRIPPSKPGDKEQEGVPLYLLGFGRPGELDEDIMRHLAQATGGQYFHARNQRNLLDIFEQLSNRLHDDGINEADLQKLAFETGGQYYHARDATKMHFILEQVVQDIQRTDFQVTFDDLDQKDDGLRRDVKLVLEHQRQAVAEIHQQIATHGLVIPEVDLFVYLGLLSILGLLLLLPVGLSRRRRLPPAK